MEIFNKDIQAARDTDELINLKSILHICLTKWYWFAVSIVTMLIAGYIYIKKTPPTYVRTASIIVKDDSKGALSAETSAFQEIGLMQTNTNVNNEIISMKSYDVMTEVVKRLGLDISYKTKGRFYDPVLYGNNLPIKIVFEGLGNNQTAKFVIKISSALLIAVLLSIYGLARKRVRLIASSHASNFSARRASSSPGEKTVLSHTCSHRLLLSIKYPQVSPAR